MSVLDVVKRNSDLFDICILVSLGIILGVYMRSSPEVRYLPDFELVVGAVTWILVLWFVMAFISEITLRHALKRTQRHNSCLTNYSHPARISVRLPDIKCIENCYCQDGIHYFDMEVTDYQVEDLSYLNPFLKDRKEENSGSFHLWDLFKRLNRKV